MCGSDLRVEIKVFFGCNSLKYLSFVNKLIRKRGGDSWRMKKRNEERRDEGEERNDKRNKVINEMIKKRKNKRNDKGKR